MSDFRFYHPIHVRYGDIDSQWHVNNTRHLAYIEDARTAYLLNLDLWDPNSFLELGFILVDTHIAYHKPILLGQEIEIGIRVAKIGNKSITFEYQIEDSSTRQVMASAESVHVAYDYSTKTSHRVTDEWRKKINAFEGRD